MTYNVLNQYNQYNETIASRGSHGSMNFVAVRCVRRCGLRIAFVAHAQKFRCSAERTPLWATHCLRRIRQPKHFVSLAVRAPLWAAHCRVASDCPRPSLLCNAYAAAGCALSSSHPTVQAFCFLCGAYAAVGCALSSSHPTTQAFRFPCSACAAVGCALPCCIRLPKTFVALQCMIFFSIGLLVLIGLCFFYRLETSAPGLSGYYW